MHYIKSNNFLFCIALLSIFHINFALAKEVTEPLPEGVNRTIQTANTLHQVRLRLKSLGPGFCSTRVLFANNIYNFGAPPLTWSNWYKLEPAVAGVAVDISISSQCDGQVLGEIKYQK